jgi:hypothetical protein
LLVAPTIELDRGEQVLGVVDHQAWLAERLELRGGFVELATRALQVGERDDHDLIGGIDSERGTQLGLVVGLQHGCALGIL